MSDPNSQLLKSLSKIWIELSSFLLNPYSSLDLDYFVSSPNNTVICLDLAYLLIKLETKAQV